jgi:hypothetical protein
MFALPLFVASKVSNPAKLTRGYAHYFSKNMRNKNPLFKG